MFADLLQKEADDEKSDAVEIFAYFKTQRPKKVSEPKQVDDKFADVFEKLKGQIGEDKAVSLIKAFNRFSTDVEAIDEKFAGLTDAIVGSMFQEKEAQPPAPAEQSTKAAKSAKADKAETAGK
jgi:hypothetical protein